MTLEEKVNEINIALIKVDERCKSNTHRLKEAEEKIDETINLVTAIKELAIETKYMREYLNATIKRLDKLETKDEGKWDKFKWAVLVAIIGIIIGYLATTLGLK